MPNQPTTILGILNGLAALLGLYVAGRAYQAYDRTQARFMLILATAFLVMTGALVVEGFVFEVLGWPLAKAHVVEAVFNLLAFLILAASLHAPGPTQSERIEGAMEADEAGDEAVDEPGEGP